MPGIVKYGKQSGEPRRNFERNRIPLLQTDLPGQRGLCKLRAVEKELNAQWTVTVVLFLSGGESEAGLNSRF